MNSTLPRRILEFKLSGLGLRTQPPPAAGSVCASMNKLDGQGLTAKWAHGGPSTPTGGTFFKDRLGTGERSSIQAPVKNKATARVFTE